MAEYVNREAVLEEIDEMISNIAFTSPYESEIHLIVDGAERARDRVCDAPAADVVEVVRCRDCKHWTVDGLGHPWCNMWEDYQHHEEVFCYYGERRDTDG